jgi:hypothetical protein
VVLVAAVVATVAFGGNALLASLFYRVTYCLPGDFPKYPGSSETGYSYELNAPKPGSVCHMTFVTGDSESRVYAFYESKLNTGNWQVTSDLPSGDGTGGQIMFEGKKTGRPHGSVIVEPYGGDQAQIIVEVDG